MNSIIVSMDWLSTHLADEDLIIVDCRFALGNPESGKSQYEEEHIPGAYYLDLEQDLSSSKEKHGGRHPLPNMDELAMKLGNIGINQASTVIAYDDQGGAMAARLWWLLTFMGLKKVYVMDGGFTKWKEAGYKVSNEKQQPNPIQFSPQLNPNMMVSMEDVRNKLNQKGTTMIDSREEARYRGEIEPIDPIAGHIPGAINHFWKNALDADGNWKPSKEQKARFDSIDKSDEIIVYCGSGVTACPNVIALKEAGFSNVKLYVGSWSDWVSYPSNPVERS